MQYKIKYIFIAIGILFLSACGDENKITPLPAKITETTLLHEFDVESISDISGMNLVDSILILSFRRNDSIFCAYNINTGKNIIKFGANGHQKDEFLFCEPLNNFNHTADNLVICDLNLNCFKSINLKEVIESGTTQDKVAVVYNMYDKLPNFGRMSSSPDFKTIIGESCYGANMDASAHIMVYDNDKIQKIASPFYKKFSYPDEYCAKVADDYHFAVNYDKQIIAAAYRSYDAILFYDFQGKIVNNITLSEWQKLDFIRENDYYRTNNPTLYYNDMRNTNDYIYVSRVNMPETQFYEYLEQNKEIKTDILKIDWNGKIVDLYRFDTLISNFSVDNNDSILTILSKDMNDKEKVKIKVYEI